MKVPDKIYLPKEEIEERKPWIETEYDPNWDECYIRKDMVVEAIKLAWGAVSMNPFDCSEAFVELLKMIGYEIH